LKSGKRRNRTRAKRGCEMACQCNVCVGTGRCRACRGTGELEESDPRSFRRIRRHRFDSSDPQPYGVWRYQASLPVRRKPQPVPNAETVAKPDPAPTPECANEVIGPCAAECWRPCAQCGKLVCEGHDYLVPVWPPENGGCDRADMLCRECITALWATGYISQDARVQYLC
jgi:hypothetical protein